jgi:hypothetical protein
MGEQLTVLERLVLLELMQARAREPSRRTTQAIARESCIKRPRVVVRLLTSLERRRPPLLRREVDAESGIVVWQITPAAIAALDSDPVDA